MECNTIKEEIKTFVFIDLETTCLDKAKITEICLIGVEKSAILWCNSSSYPPIPRVQHKLLLCVNPMRPISHFASNITGLHNDDLDNCPTMDKDTAETIVKFISLLPQPVCFIAHNGNMFDFPILNAHMERAGIKFSDRVYCADSLTILKAIDMDDDEMTRMSRSPQTFESPILTTSVKTPEAPRKRKSCDKIIDFDVSDKAGKLCDSTPNSGHNAVPKVVRNVTVKRNLLSELDAQSKRPMHLNMDNSSENMPTSTTPTDCNNSAALTAKPLFVDKCKRLSSASGDGITSENDGIVLIEQNTDEKMDTEDDKDVSIMWGDSWDANDLLNVMDDIARRNETDVTSDTQNKPQDLESVACNKIEGNIDTNINVCSTVKTESNQNAAALLPGSDTSVMTASKNSQICLSGELTPEKRSCEVQSPPKTPVKMQSEKVPYKNYSFTRSLNSSFTENSTTSPITLLTTKASGNSCSGTSKMIGIDQGNTFGNNATKNLITLGEQKVSLDGKKSPPNAGKTDTIIETNIKIEQNPVVSNDKSPEFDGVKSPGVSSNFRSMSLTKVDACDADAEKVSFANNNGTVIKPAFHVNGTRDKSSKISDTSPTFVQNVADCMTTPPPSQITKPWSNNGRKSYKLTEIYKRQFGQEPLNSHTAEDDCLSMLKLAVARSKEFCALVDKQCVPISNIAYRR